MVQQSRIPNIAPVKLLGKLSSRQAAKVRQLARYAHQEAMHSRGASAVAREQVDFIRSLSTRLARAEEEVRRLSFNPSSSLFERANSEATQIREQLGEAKSELARLQHSAGKAIAEYAGPTNQLIDRILQTSRVDRATLGIDFD